MRISFRNWVPLGLFFVVAVVLWQGLRHDPHKLKSALINNPLPAFSLPSLMHPEQVMHKTNLAGHVVVLNVFASWCLSCQIEHPTLIGLSRHSSAMWVGLDFMDKPDSARAFLSENGNPFQAILSDPKGKFAINLGVYGVPETFVIDKSGIIRFRHTGPLTEAVWENEVGPEVRRWQ